MRLHYVALIAALGSLACGTARRGEPLAGSLNLAGDEAGRRGHLVFTKYCHSCHPGGEAGLAPAINDKPFPDFLKKFQVRAGLGAMPAFKTHVIFRTGIE
jgi:mono/diheme cytochrome c family protein